MAAHAAVARAVVLMAWRRFIIINPLYLLTFEVNSFRLWPMGFLIVT